MKYALLLTLGILTVFACKTKKEIEVKEEAMTSEEVSSEAVEFSIAKGGCFGNCPIFVMKVYGGGLAEFTGERHTDKIGSYTRQLEAQEYKTIKALANKLDFKSLQGSYKSNIPDLPLVTLIVSKDGKTKTVKGKEDRPEDLMNYQRVMEQFAFSGSWDKVVDPAETAAQDSIDQAMKLLNQDEIIIEPKPGVGLPPWFKKMKEQYSINILKRIAPNQNLWLVTYDQSMYKPDEIMKILKNDDSIQFAEFNKKTENRGN